LELKEKNENFSNLVANLQEKLDQLRMDFDLKLRVKEEENGKMESRITSLVNEKSGFLFLNLKLRLKLNSFSLRLRISIEYTIFRI
jgi:hypothetical protein